MVSSKKPEIGMGATIQHWSDSTATTIIYITPKRLILREDNAQRVDKNGMSESQEYVYSPNPEGKQWLATLRKDGSWRIAKSTQIVTLDVRRQYYDYSF
jgi:hypothetical protein